MKCSMKMESTVDSTAAVISVRTMEHKLRQLSPTQKIVQIVSINHWFQLSYKQDLSLNLILHGKYSIMKKQHRISHTVLFYCTLFSKQQHSLLPRTHTCTIHHKINEKWLIVNLKDGTVHIVCLVAFVDKDKEEIKHSKGIRNREGG